MTTWSDDAHDVLLQPAQLDVVSEAGPRHVCERIARCDLRTAAAQQQLEHLITQWRRERAHHAESTAARRNARLEAHYGTRASSRLRMPSLLFFSVFLRESGLALFSGTGRRAPRALQLGARGRARARCGA